MKRLIVPIVWCVLLASPVWAERATDAYTPVQKTATVTAAQSATTLWTPATGQRIALQGCFASTVSAITFKVQSSGVDVIPSTVITSYGSVMIGGNYAVIWEGGKDATLTYTTSNSGVSNNLSQFSILCWGYEENR